MRARRIGLCSLTRASLGLPQAAARGRSPRARALRGEARPQQGANLKAPAVFHRGARRAKSRSALQSFGESSPKISAQLGAPI